MLGIGTGEGSRSKNVLPARFGTVVQINKFLTMQDITDKALEIGFHLVGKTSIEPLFEWKREVEKRIDEDLIPGEAWSGRNLQFTPGKIMPHARQVLILVRSYKPLAEPFPSATPVYSAHYREYPIGLRQAVSFTEWLRQMDICASVASNLPLKALAVKSGLGVYRRNSLVYSKTSGSFMTLYGVVTDTEIKGNTLCSDLGEVASDCGKCNRCIHLCPTGAIKPQGIIDLSKCIRNHMGSGRLVPPEIRKAYGVRLLGCEICQRVCPKNADILKDLSLPPHEELEAFSLPKLLELSQRPSKKALENIGKVIGRNYARKNRILGDAVIAAGNTEDPHLLKYLKDTLKYPHVPVRAHSAWAIGRIGTPNARKILTLALNEERDPEVISEIKSAITESD
ncbi:MAG: epoxyqueuosine reductase [Firmicutes bacterium]|nr:epoxyqueuosine reductase [Bacillota bacterium]HXL05184.1 4Fe-4S double cluster binding domain-containing protein [Bacillota bacterium]